MIPEKTCNPSILIVDDDEEIRTLIGQFLRKYCFEVYLAEDGVQMEAQLQQGPVDLVILDIMMPGDDGFELCRRLRKTSQIPILMLSAAGDDTDRIVGLEMGADDYLPKPFNPRELLARVKAIMRRSETSLQKASINPSIESRHAHQNQVHFFNDWQLDTSMRRLISPDGLDVELTAGEYSLLLTFLENPLRVQSRDQLLENTHNRSAGPFDRTIDVQVSRLRQKIEDDPKSPKMIKTVRGGGYMFSVKVTIKSEVLCD